MKIQKNFIYQLKKLQSIALFSSGINTSLPDELYNMPNFKILHITYVSNIIFTVEQMKIIKEKNIIIKRYFI